jgi:hypothetical protein
MARLPRVGDGVSWRVILLAESAAKTTERSFACIAYVPPEL